jgi:hypothetical protein
LASKQLELLHPTNPALAESPWKDAQEAAGALGLQGHLLHASTDQDLGHTREIPVVFLLSIDPLAEGLIASVPRPGSNVTGFTQSDYSLGGKWPQLLKEMVPTITSAVVIMSNVRWSAGYMRSIEDAARALSISVTVIEIHNQSEIEQKITALRDANGGLIFPPNSFTADNRPQIIELVTRLRLPSIYHARFYVLENLVPVRTLVAAGAIPRSN